MEHRKKLFILAVAAGLALGVRFWYETLRAPEAALLAPNSASPSIRMRNATWWTTFESGSIPYASGDRIEILIVPDSGFDIHTSSLNGETVSKYLSWYAIHGWTPGKSEPVRITGTARVGNGGNGQSAELEQVLREGIVITSGTGTGQRAKEIPASVDTQSPLGNVRIVPNRLPKGMPTPIQIEWADCQTYPYAVIWGISSKTKSIDGMCYAFVDPENLVAGEHSVWLQDSEGSLRAIGQSLTIEGDSSALQVAQVTPNEFDSEENTYIVLQGKGFAKAISAQLSNTVIIRNAEFRTLNDHVATIQIPKGLPPGEYGINFMTQNTITSPKWATFRISK